ncbi:AAA family ATPase [Gelidibacter salicanalis]|uniref:AAA family ATPase n=1 Tax=Gelidibacter salicanalis TaxID=291193 RepID=UPI001FEB6D17|nr:AAA family ATPase [Gelidibacter salicanalis]
MQLQQAQRQQVKLRIGLSGPSGFGKTYSALLLAKGITNDYTKIAVIDTENGSASLYSHLGRYNTITLQAPFSPEKYIAAIEICEKAKMEVIIIDSITHEWTGAGGCLEIHDQLGGKLGSCN